MFSNRDTWDLACELARSGDYANVVMIERELRRRGVLERGQSVTISAFRRELLTRACHAARSGNDATSRSRNPRMLASGSLGFSFDLP